MDYHNRLLYLFDRLTQKQQTDLLNLMEAWNSMPQATVQASDSSSLNPALQETLGRDWHCLNALKKVVQTHFPPHLELAYVAFHPLLDSVSTAKSSTAAEQMYVLEAAYELKRIFESDSEAEMYSPDIKEQLHNYFYQQEPK